MTNPNNAIGTNGAYGGRTSVNAFNDNLAIFQGRGVLSGFAISPNTGMSVAIGGDGTTRDVAIAEDNIGNKTTIDNISESPISLTIAGAPASNSRIDAIVAYVDNPAQGSATETDNPSACGLLDVQGAVSATPSQPDENAIRTAITTDGASGSTAYYVVLGYITIANGTTDITSNMIEQGGKASIGDNLVGSNAVTDGAITSEKITDGAVTNSKLAAGVVSNSKIADGAIITSKLANESVSNSKIANGAISASKIAWDTIFERQTKTITLDNTGNASLNIYSNACWILAVNQIGSDNYINGNIAVYTWQDGKYYIHVDKNFDHAYATGSIQIEILTIARSTIGF